MQQTRLNKECINCLANRYAYDYPANCDDAVKDKYIQAVFDIIKNAGEKESAPILVERIDKLKLEMFGSKKDFTQIKKYYNSLMLSLEDSISERIDKSRTPLVSAIKYAIMGNYIDFGAMKSVDQDKLLEFIYKAEEIALDKQELLKLSQELSLAENLVYLTDNCGEIVLDKLLIKTILKLYPELNIDVIVRGDPVLNDATSYDACQVGIDKIVSVCGNGTAIGGTSLERIAKEAKEKIDNADLIIAKGQGNFETLRFCGKNIYYLFMCKCKMFAEFFGVPLYSGVLTNDLRLNT